MKNIGLETINYFIVNIGENEYLTAEQKLEIILKTSKDTLKVSKKRLD